MSKKYNKHIFKDLGNNVLEHIPTGYYVKKGDEMQIKNFLLHVEVHLLDKDKDYKKSFKDIQPLLWDFFYNGVLCQKYSYGVDAGLNEKVDNLYYGLEK